MKSGVLFLALFFAALAARAVPDNIWSHINTACTQGQVPIKDVGQSWSCGSAVDNSIWRVVGPFIYLATPATPIRLTGSAVTAASFAGSGAGLTNLSVDFSTITTALATKLSSTTAVPISLIDLSTVTAALATKHGLTIATSEIDLSTVTTALATKASTGTDNSMTRANALATLGAAVVAVTTITASGQINMGWEQISNTCNAATTCTATCSANKMVTGCGNCNTPAVLGVSVTTGGSSTATSCTCTTLTSDNITSVAYCARIGN